MFDVDGDDAFMEAAPAEEANESIVSSGTHMPPAPSTAGSVLTEGGLPAPCTPFPGPVGATFPAEQMGNREFRALRKEMLKLVQQAVQETVSPAGKLLGVFGKLKVLLDSPALKDVEEINETGATEHISAVQQHVDKLKKMKVGLSKWNLSYASRPSPLP